MISHTFTNVHLGQTFQLQEYIPNMQNTRLVCLKSIIYWIGWYNVKGKQHIATKTKQIDIESGLYNFKDLKDIFSKENIDLSVNKNNGIATLEIPVGTEIEISKGTLALLGIASKRGRFTAGRYIGTKMVDFAKPKELHVYLDQINTTDNFENGVPSSLLAIIPISDISFGKCVHLSFDRPVFKNLTNGCITELSFRITDENEVPIDNHGLPILVELNIQ